MKHASFHFPPCVFAAPRCRDCANFILDQRWCKVRNTQYHPDKVVCSMHYKPRPVDHDKEDDDFARQDTVRWYCYDCQHYKHLGWEYDFCNYYSQKADPIAFGCKNRRPPFHWI